MVAQGGYLLTHLFDMSDVLMHNLHALTCPYIPTHACGMTELLVWGMQ